MISIEHSIQQTETHDKHRTLYPTNTLSNKQRRMISGLRGGVLPIELEKGRWRGRPRNERLWKQCNTGLVEDIPHFLYTCPATILVRNKFTNLLHNDINDLIKYDVDDKTKALSNLILCLFENRQ